MCTERMQRATDGSDSQVQGLPVQLPQGIKAKPSSAAGRLYSSKKQGAACTFILSALQKQRVGYVPHTLYTGHLLLL